MKYTSSVEPRSIKLALGLGANFKTDKLTICLHGEDGKELSGNGYKEQSLKVKWDGEVLHADSVVFEAIGGSWTALTWEVEDETLKLTLLGGYLNEDKKPVTVTDDNTLTISVPSGFFTLK